MKRETIAGVRDHLKTVAGGLTDMAKLHSDKAKDLPVGDDQKMHADLGNKCAKLAGVCIACHKAMDDGDTEPVVSNEGNRGANFGGGGLDGPKILVGGDLAKAYDEVVTPGFSVLTDHPLANKAVLREGMRAMPEADPSAALDRELAKVTQH